MPRPKKQEDIVFVDELPLMGSSRGKWVVRLTPLLKARNRLARVAQLDTPTQAQDASNNLSQRKVIIPKPDHDWFFAARGCDVYAQYRGPMTKGAK